MTQKDVGLLHRLQLRQACKQLADEGLGFSNVLVPCSLNYQAFQQ